MASIFSLLTLKSFITVDKDLHELDKRKILSLIKKAIRGNITLSWKLPDIPAIVMAWSFEITLTQDINVASGITGFILPGIILLPGCKDFKEISDSPNNGPEFIHLKSFEILVRLTAKDFKVELKKIESSWQLKPSNLSFFSKKLFFLVEINFMNSYSNKLCIAEPSWTTCLISKTVQLKNKIVWTRYNYLTILNLYSTYLKGESNYDFT